ncbi:TetR family transcriptional regulator [Streptomyces sp. RS10V-4]|uniref:acyl-CoA-like ligand-binding transcription factor n=1 Tax=Streptomyces rhizoryzae TaxID=2932493 RepID=UPI002002B11F|nr:TetR family transcriptional regulator [Streptomyces rhizoryzae]MCK7622341.1 TetR family transcriptional regulator [Streptomyces rhizoryzae]
MPQEDDARTGLRERKKRATRVALSQATIRLCVQHGWDNVTVEDIAAAANVSVRTFRNYFSGKAEAIAAGHLERMLRIADELRARPADEPLWDSLARAVHTQFAPADAADGGPAHDQRWRDGLRLMLAEPALQGEVVKANAAAQDELAKAVAARTGTDEAHDLYPQLVAAVVSAGSAVAVEHCLRADSPAPLGPVLTEVFAQLTQGLPTP